MKRRKVKKLTVSLFLFSNYSGGIDFLTTSTNNMLTQKVKQIYKYSNNLIFRHKRENHFF